MKRNASASQHRVPPGTNALTLDSLRDRLPKPTHNRLLMIAKRIRSIVLTRAACISWIALAALTVIGIAIDALFVMPLATRWTISAVIFGLSIFAFCWAYLPRLRQVASLNWLAQVIETAAPKMKHQLRSALDLASEPLLKSAQALPAMAPGQTLTAKSFSMGSPAFIDAFQMQVAGNIESVAPHHVVKWKSIRRWMLIAAALVGLYTVCLAIPDLSFAKRIGRVWFPSLNIGRITLYELVIDAPNNPWIEIRNDLFSVRASATVGSPKSMVLEIETDSAERRRIEMQAVADETQTFTQNIALDGQSARIRVVAYDSTSSWYDIELVDRPNVAPKSITLHFPEYAAVPPLTIDDWNGDIDCVNGTRVQATYQSSSLLKSCEWLFEQGRVVSRNNDAQVVKTPDVVSLSIKSNLQQLAEFAVWTSGRYALKAIDDRTGKTSDTTRTYSVTARADQPAKLKWVGLLPSRAQFIAANEITTLQAAFSDEFPLAKAHVEYSIDESDWKAFDLVPSELNSGLLEWSLDPLSMALKNSQLIEVRFVAIDRNQQRTISDTSQWLINDSYTPADRWEVLRQRYDTVLKLQNLTNRWTEWMKESDSIWQMTPEKTLAHLRKIPRNTEAVNELKSSLVGIIDQSNEFVEQDSMMDLALHLQRTVDSDLAQASLQIARLDDSASKETLNQTRGNLREVVRAFERMHKSAYQLFGEDLMLAANQDMTSILDAQRTLLASTKEINALQVRDRQTAIGGILENLINKLLSYAKALPENEQASFTLQLRNLRQTHSSIASITSRSLMQKNSYWSTDESKRWIEQTLQQLEQYHRMHTLLDGYFGQHRENRKQLAPQYAIWFSPLAKVRQQYERIASSSNASNTLQMIVDAQHQTKQLSDLMAQARILESQRLSIDRFYLSDIGNIRRAILNVTSDSFGALKDQTAALKEISDASRFLAASHRMKLAIELQHVMHSIEADGKALESQLRADQPRNFNDVGFLVEQAREQTQELQLNESIREAWQVASWSPTLQVIGDSMNNRRWSRDPIQRVSASQREILDRTEQAKLDSEPRIEEARQVILKYVPKVSEVANQAAKRVEETKQAIAEMKSPSNEKAAEQKQKDANQAVEAVKQSLQDLAAVQDLLTEDEAKIARDADQAIQAVEASAQAAQQATQKATEQDSNPNIDKAAKAADMQKALDAQDMLQNVLNQVAEHFEKIEQGDTPNQPFATASNKNQPASEEQNSDSVQSQAPLQEREEAYQEAEFLRELAALSPQAILKQLEQELPNRESMQESLEDINSQSLQETAATLQSVSAKQRELTRELEMSDPVAQANLQNTVEQMHQLSRFLRKLSDQQINWALQSTGRSQLNDVQQKMNETRSQLNQLAEQLSSASTETTLAELNQRAQQIQQASQKLNNEFEQAAKSVMESELKPISNDERQLKNLEREAKDWQSRYRRENDNWLNGETRHRENHLEQQKRQVENRQKQVSEAQQRLNKERERFNKSKQEVNDQLQLQRAEQQVTAAERELEATKAKQTSAQAMADRAKQLNEIADRSPEADIKLENPHQGLAKSFVEQTSSLLSGVTEHIDQLTKDISQFEAPQSRIESARSASDKEQSLIKDVQRSKSDLDRASRHAERLQQEKIADDLKQLATKSDSVVNQNMQPAAESLSKAAQQPSPQQLPNPRLDEATAKSAIDDLRETQQSLSEMKNKLEDIADQWNDETRQDSANEERRGSQTSAPAGNSTANADANSPTNSGSKPSTKQPQGTTPDKNSTPNNGSGTSATPSQAPSFGDYLSEPEMARLLDDLDRLVYNSQRQEPKQEQQQSDSGDQQGQNSSGQQSSSNQSKSNSSSQSSQGKQAMQSAADKLADMLAQQRAAADNQKGPSQKGQQSKSQQASTAQSQSMSTSPAAGDVETPESSSSEAVEPNSNATDGTVNKNWASLRTSELENGTGQSRQGGTSAYQTSIDAYFKALSKLRSAKP